MKKIIIAILFCSFSSIIGFAKSEQMAQRIVTDCGTVHTISSNSRVNEACYWLDYYSNQDCGTNYVLYYLV